MPCSTVLLPSGETRPPEPRLLRKEDTLPAPCHSAHERGGHRPWSQDWRALPPAHHSASYPQERALFTPFFMSHHQGTIARTLKDKIRSLKLQVWQECRLTRRGIKPSDERPEGANRYGRHCARTDRRRGGNPKKEPKEIC